MNKMFNLIEILSDNKNTSKEQAAENIRELDTFRFRSNNILNSVSQLMVCAADGGDFKPSEEVFRDIGDLLSILSGLNCICEEQAGFYKGEFEKKESITQ